MNGDLTGVIEQPDTVMVTRYILILRARGTDGEPGPWFIDNDLHETRAAALDETQFYEGVCGRMIVRVDDVPLTAIDPEADE